MQKWVEIEAEDSRRNRITLRLARTERGIKLLAPAANVTHVIGNHVEDLREQLETLAERSDERTLLADGHR